MSANHHLQAKVATDSILSKFKTSEWSCINNIGTGLYRVGCDSSFPSPDAAFYEDSAKMMMTFEFKPPTETKRGILTGLGQAIAYLNNSNLSYLVIPEMLEDFHIADYMLNLFANQIKDNLPVGLIKYDNNNPDNVSLLKNVLSSNNNTEFSSRDSGRFWAKHQDLPLPLLHLILHCYYLKKTGIIEGDAFAYCWNTYMSPIEVVETLKPVVIFDINGLPIKTLSGTKNIAFLEKRIKECKVCSDVIDKNLLKEKLVNDIDSSVTGDNYYNSVKKNYVTFLKHIGFIDSTGNITNLGFKLYHIGVVNGTNSKLFVEYFTKYLLIQGHHLDLIFDLDNLRNSQEKNVSIGNIKAIMQAEYEERGMIKRNPKRQVGATSKVSFLKYEFILWRALDLFDNNYNFNWRKIIEICSLPEM